MRPAIVIFDMDGTLIDSSVDITASVNHVRAHLNLPPLSCEAVVSAINAQERNLAKLFYEKEHYEEAERRLFEAHYYEECIKSVTLYEGIRETLCHLRESGVHCSVATNAPQKYALRMLEHLGVLHHFDYVEGACSHPSKPDPAMLRHILNAYKYATISSDRAYMVGDNEKDLLAARRAGITGVHVSWGFAEDSFETTLTEPQALLQLLKTLP